MSYRIFYKVHDSSQNLPGGVSEFSASLTDTFDAIYTEIKTDEMTLISIQGPEDIQYSLTDIISEKMEEGQTVIYCIRQTNPLIR